jgi:hypothetical protein
VGLGSFPVQQANKSISLDNFFFGDEEKGNKLRRWFSSPSSSETRAQLSRAIVSRLMNGSEQQRGGDYHFLFAFKNICASSQPEYIKTNCCERRLPREKC